ncbi:hypothetical protein NDU88_009531, partial [Pleurodeles waltl]
GETSLRTCVTPEAEGDAWQRKQEEKTPKKMSSILDPKRTSQEKQTNSEDESGTQPKELWREYEATEENRDSDPSAEDEAKHENANTAHHVPGGTWLLQVRAHLPNVYQLVMGRKRGGQEGS